MKAANKKAFERATTEETYRPMMSRGSKFKNMLKKSPTPKTVKKENMY